jgi:hypothetical protein
MDDGGGGVGMGRGWRICGCKFVKAKGAEIVRDFVDLGKNASHTLGNDGVLKLANRSVVFFPDHKGNPLEM